MAQASFNAEEVSISVNKISMLIADIDTRNKKFIELINRSNQKMNNGLLPLVTLESRISEEQRNIDQILKDIDQIGIDLRQYGAHMDDLNDDSAFRG